MQERDALSQDVLGQVAPRASKYGVDLSRVGVKDLTLPGAVKAVFLQEVEAELKGRASLVAAGMRSPRRGRKPISASFLTRTRT